MLALALASLARAEALKTPVWAEGPVGAFEVTLDGARAEVLSVQTPEDNLVLLVVLDTVRYPDRAVAAGEALVAGLRGLGPRYYAGLLTAQDGLTVLQDPIRGRKKLQEALESVDVRGLPGLLEVIAETSRLADRTFAAANVRLAALFLTDGAIEDYRGDYTIPVVNPSDRSDLSRRFRGQLILERVRSIADQLQSAQAPLFFLHLARSHDELNEVYQNGISEFARLTGGQALFAQAVQEVPAMVGQLLDAIAGHSVLRIEADCDGAHRLAVRLGGEPVRHRESVSCPPEAP